VLVIAAYSLVNIAAVRMLWREDRGEFAISIIATLGVVVVGSVDAVLFAVVLALLRFVRIVARPTWEVLGEVAGMPDYHSVARHPDAKTIPGICLFRFNAPLVFFNAPYFKRSALEAAVEAGPRLRWFVLDALPITGHDVTGRHVMHELERELAARRVQIVLAGRRTEVADWRLEKGFDKTRPTSALHYPTLRAAVQAFQREFRVSGEPAGGSA
jgi:MFS superfamily sulfate permease-like transporter